jgi:hypothetical protein
MKAPTVDDVTWWFIVACAAGGVGVLGCLLGAHL